MRAVKVQYTVKDSYVETNKQNIKRVMVDLRELNPEGLKYSSFLLDDGKSFVHFSMASSEEAQSVLTNLPSFQEFQRQLRESGPEVPPNPESLTLVASGYEIF